MRINEVTGYKQTKKIYLFLIPGNRFFFSRFHTAAIILVNPIEQKRQLFYQPNGFIWE